VEVVGLTWSFGSFYFLRELYILVSLYFDMGVVNTLITMAYLGLEALTSQRMRLIGLEC
jgi:hypothetical protein